MQPRTRQPLTVRLGVSIAWLLVAIAPATATELPLGEFRGDIETIHPDWFKQSFLDFEEDIAESTAAGRRLVLYFWQTGCPYCNALVEHNFAQRDIADTMQEHFDLVAINMWGDREVGQVGGRSFTEKTLAAALKVQYTPTLIFFGEGRNVVLRLNGYLPPDAFRAALEYVYSRAEMTSSFNEFLALHGAGTESGMLHNEKFFAPPPFDLHTRSGRPLAVFFEQARCRQCDTLHQKVLTQPIVRAQVEKMRAVQLDLWSDTPVTTPDGRATTARTWARELAINFAPTVVFFDAGGREVIRLEAAFKTFHTQGIFRYVLEQAYQLQPSFQRYLSDFARRLREQGYDVDIWSYEQPVTRAGKTVMID